MLGVLQRAELSKLMNFAEKGSMVEGYVTSVNLAASADWGLGSLKLLGFQETKFSLAEGIRELLLSSDLFFSPVSFNSPCS